MEVYEKTIAEQVEKQAEIDNLAVKAEYHEAKYEFEKEQQEYENFMAEVEAWKLRKTIAQGEYELVLFLFLLLVSSFVYLQSFFFFFDRSRPRKRLTKLWPSQLEKSLK